MTIASINDWIAIRITNAVGTMWCTYAFAGLALVSLPEAIKGGTGPLIAWTAQTFLQLILLPIILVGQNLGGQSAERRAQTDHEAIMEELDLLKGLHVEIHAALGIEMVSCGVSVTH
jgi:hypothetical protein